MCVKVHRKPECECDAFPSEGSLWRLEPLEVQEKANLDKKPRLLKGKGSGETVLAML